MYIYIFYFKLYIRIYLIKIYSIKKKNNFFFVVSFFFYFFSSQIYVVLNQKAYTYVLIKIYFQNIIIFFVSLIYLFFRWSNLEIKFDKVRFDFNTNGVEIRFERVFHNLIFINISFYSKNSSLPIAVPVKLL